MKAINNNLSHASKLADFSSPDLPQSPAPLSPPSTNVTMMKIPWMCPLSLASYPGSREGGERAPGIHRFAHALNHDNVFVYLRLIPRARDVTTAGRATGLVKRMLYWSELCLAEIINFRKKEQKA